MLFDITRANRNGIDCVLLLLHMYLLKGQETFLDLFLCVYELAACGIIRSRLETLGAISMSSVDESRIKAA